MSPREGGGARSEVPEHGSGGPPYVDGALGAPGPDGEEQPMRGPVGAPPQRYGRYVALVGLVILVLITINTIVTKPNGASGVAPGEQLPPFAVPLALSNLKGDADVATRPDEGEAGRIPACRLRRPDVLNVCALYEGAPVVLALFVNGGGCTTVLSRMQALVGAYPGVRFAAVALRGDRGSLRSTIHSRGLTFPVGIDEEGTLAALYKIASCPQVTFALPGGAAHGHALLSTPSQQELRARVGDLVAAARARGWREPAG
jgi:hypothetical protein